jgi:hypothetical protein
VASRFLGGFKDAGTRRVLYMSRRPEISELTGTILSARIVSVPCLLVPSQSEQPDLLLWIEPNNCMAVTLSSCTPYSEQSMLPICIRATLKD